MPPSAPGATTCSGVSCGGSFQDVLVTTRAGLNIMAARFARKRVVTIAQEHLHFEAHLPGIFEEIKAWYPKLDAVVTLTEADAQDYRTMLGQAPTRVFTIGNGLPGGPRPRSRQENRIVLAAGRLVPVKGYDRLLKAFAQVVRERPDWKLRIYGEGRVSDKLVKLAVKLRLHNNVTFMGRPVTSRANSPRPRSTRSAPGSRASA